MASLPTCACPWLGWAGWLVATPPSPPPHPTRLQRKLIAASSGLAAALVALVLVARALTLGPLIALANTWRPTPCRISLRQGAVIAWAGSLRGASECGAALDRSMHACRCLGRSPAWMPHRLSSAASSAFTPPHTHTVLVTVAMALKVFGARGKGEPLDSQIVVVASNSAVIIFVGAAGGGCGCGGCASSAVQRCVSMQPPMAFHAALPFPSVPAVVLGGLTSRLLDLLLPPAELDGYASMASHPTLDHGGARCGAAL